MKSYTDLEQSKKLAEILPLESADMNWHELPSIGLFVRAFPYKRNNGATEGLYPCWSLAALLEILPSHFYDETGRKSFGLDKGDYTYCVFYESKNAFIQTIADNPVNACVAMIERLHEQKLL